MRNKSVLCSILLSASLAACMAISSAAAAGRTPELPVLSMPEIYVANGQSFSYPINLKNPMKVRRILLPLSFLPSTLMELDSVTINGTRLEGLGGAAVQIDNGARTVSFDFNAVPNGFVPEGDGTIALLYFTVGQNSPTEDVTVDTTFIPPDKHLEITDSLDFPLYVLFTPNVIHIITTRPIIDLDPEVFYFTATEGINPPPQTLSITNLGIDPLNWRITHKPHWLKVSVDSGTAPSYVDLAPDVSGLAVGNYFDSVAVTDTIAIVKTLWAYIYLCVEPGPELTVAGKVVDPSPAGIEGAAVEIWDSYPHGVMLYDTLSGVDGRFEFYGVPDGDYDLYVSKTGYVPVTKAIQAPDTILYIVLYPVPTEDTVCIELHEGWNLISWNVDTPDDYIETIIADIKGCVDVVLGFEFGAATYDPELPQFSTLDYLDHLHGYWFRMDCDTVLCLSGPPVDPQTPIDLEANWNLVSYLPDDSNATALALESILDKLVVALGFDGGGLSYDPEHPELSDLLALEPQFGYWLKTTGAATLVYPGPQAISGQNWASAGSMKAYLPPSGVNSTPEWVDFYGEGITLDGVLLPVGSVVALFDEEGNLCGQATVSNSGKIAFTPAYRDDRSSALDEGADYGSQISLTVNGVPTEQTYTFTKLGDRIQLGSLTSLERVSADLPREFRLSQNVPNPFNPSTGIEFGLPTSVHATLEVYNLLGEKIATLVDRLLPPGNYSVIWNGENSAGAAAATGVYFYRLRAGDFSATKKMLLVK